jgi:hypothetical protein
MTDNIILIKTSTGMLTPKYGVDMPIFKHCSLGYEAVIPGYFQIEVEPVLKLHGVKTITIESYEQESNK